VINIKCKCGEHYHADEKFIGRKIRCSNCGNILTVELSNIHTKAQIDIDSSKKNNNKSKFTKTQKKQYGFIDKIKSLKNNSAFVYTFYIILVIGVLLLFSYIKNLNSVENQKNRPISGNIYNEKLKINNQYVNQGSGNAPKHINNNESYDDWQKVDLRSGTTPDCFNFTPRYDLAINNYLTIKVGSNTDVVLKLCSYTNNKCIYICDVCTISSILRSIDRNYIRITHKLHKLHKKYKLHKLHKKYKFQNNNIFLFIFWSFSFFIKYLHCAFIRYKCTIYFKISTFSF